MVSLLAQLISILIQTLLLSLLSHICLPIPSSKIRIYSVYFDQYIGNCRWRTSFWKFGADHHHCCQFFEKCSRFILLKCYSFMYLVVMLHVEFGFSTVKMVVLTLRGLEVAWPCLFLVPTLLNAQWQHWIQPYSQRNYIHCKFLSFYTVHF